VAVIDYAGQVIAEEQRRLDTLVMPRDELIGECLAIVRRRLQDPDLDVSSVARIAMGIQGITDSHSRAMLWSPITPLTDIPFADILEREFDIPAT
ncbi:ROK family protein, partial [Mesorhizobium sp. M4B.F.Ca.ET.169.01.1.1]